MTRKMKDSGIEWIGEIPEEWEIGKVKKYYKMQTGFTPDTKKSEFYDDENGFDWVNISDLNSKRIVENTKNKISIKYIEEFSPNITPKGSLLYSFKLSVGQVAFANKDLFTNEAIASFLKNDDCNLNFLFYSSFMIIKNANENIYNAKLLNQQLIKNAYIVYPPLEEQNKIADYLDNKCYKIDQTIEKEKEVIEKLKEYKQSVITEAVTKGLNPDVKMKDSGVEWIGEIPEHWKTKKLKYEFRIKKNIAGKEGYNILSVTQNGIKIKDISKNDGQLAMDYSKYQLVDIDDFIMNHMDLLTGFVDCSKYQGVTSPDYRVFYLLDKNKDKNYYRYIFQSCYKNKIFYGLGQGVSFLGRWRLQADKFLNFNIPIPPNNEQKEIADYLDKKCSAIDKLISSKEKLIEKLTEYKKSLIYECVTGKREVQ